MEELFVRCGVLLILLAPMVSFVWQFRRVQRGLSSRCKGVVCYATYSAIPVGMYLGIFFVLVGVEELLQTPLIGEGYARSCIIVSVGGIAFVIVGTLAFSIVVACITGKAI